MVVGRTRLTEETSNRSRTGVDGCVSFAYITRFIRERVCGRRERTVQGVLRKSAGIGIKVYS